MKGLLNRSFWSGVGMCIALSSLYQDMIGKEACIHRLQEHWTDPVYSVPIAILILGLSVFGYVASRMECENPEKNKTP